MFFVLRRSAVLNPLDVFRLLYFNREEVRDLLLKSCAANAVPVLIARRMASLSANWPVWSPSNYPKGLAEDGMFDRSNFGPSPLQERQTQKIICFNKKT